MPEIDQRIIKFINKHHVLTISTSVNNQPYCANCFYVYLNDLNLFVFTSDEDTRHAKEFLINNNVAGSVVLETSVIGKIQGIQLTGKITEPQGDFLIICKNKYLKKFPVALLMKTNLWALSPDFIKMTHNQLGFGKKLIWQKEKGSEISEK
ncbi:MAG: pyridoxamine 5'-phosphate oxidase family protein [Bacteroidota bacterium]